MRPVTETGLPTTSTWLSELRLYAAKRLGQASLALTVAAFAAAKLARKLQP